MPAWRDPVERFWEKVDKQGPRQAHMKTRCWVWTAGIDRLGYSRFKVDGRTISGHQFSFSLHKKKLKPGQQIDHECNMRSCVRPTHLRGMTSAQNNARRAESKNYCPRGHDYASHAVHRIVKQIKNGKVYTYNKRVCKTCRKLYYQEKGK